MIGVLVLPAAAAVVIGLAVAASHRHLRPQFAARTLVVAAAACTLATVAAVATIAIGSLSTVHWMPGNLSWCRSLYRTHDEIPSWLGVTAVGAIVWMVASAAAAYRRDRKTLWYPAASDAELTVLPDDRPQAYAVGGRPGHIVVSSGMLRLLDARERRVLLAHERSHLHHRHHAYIAVAIVAKAAVPVLAPISQRVRLAVERWADEDAAREVGDRQLVARTIATAALAQAERPSPTALGIGLTGVGARVDALLAPSAVSSRFAHFTGGVGIAATLAVVGGSTVQLHHLVAFAAHVCGI